MPAIPNALSVQQSVKVRRFDFVGSTRFSAAELREVVKGYLGRPLTPEDLEQARVALTQLYVGRGYVNSGAVLRDQPVQPGPAGTVVTFQIVEGRLSDVRVAFLGKDDKPVGRHLLRKDYVSSRVAYAARPPLNVLKVKDELELLRQDPLLRSINAELKPGAAPGTADMDVLVREANPFQFGVQFSNRRPPSVGSTALDALITDRDLTGNGDLLSVRYDALFGPIDDMRAAEGRDYSIDYSIPISPADTTLSFDFTRTDALVVEQPFGGLSISSKVNSYALTLRQPLWRRPTAEPPDKPGGWVKPAAEFAVFLTGTIRDNETGLLGEPFNFLPGVSGGHSRVVALRFGQEFASRTADDALSLRSTFSFGIPAFGATQHGDPHLADSRFVSWLGQAQYVRRLGPMPAFLGGALGRRSPSTALATPAAAATATPGTGAGVTPNASAAPESPMSPGTAAPVTTATGDVQLVLRVAGQLTNSPLLDVEQFTVGGLDTVRGYRENQLVRDEGVAATAELRFPLIPSAGGEADVLTLAPFFDTGYARNLVGAGGAGGAARNKGESLNSVGAGLLFNPNNHVNLQVYYGYALTHRNRTHSDPQDLGLHFSLTLLAF